MLPQTGTRAAIEDFGQALDVICQVTDQDFKLSYIKIATDSSSPVNAVSRTMGQWIENDGVGSNGQKVAHFEVLKELHDKLDYMEYSDEGGRQVQFWLIPRELNGEADRLANMALHEL